MEFHGRRSFSSFIHEKQEPMSNAITHSPSFSSLETIPSSAAKPTVGFTSPRLSTDSNHRLTSSSSAATMALNPIMHLATTPPSPGSPWSFSPPRTTSPSPSLLHHCIASLHRHEGNIYTIAVAQGVVFTGSESSRIRAWRHSDCTERGYVKASCGEVRAVLAYGNSLFSAHKDHKIRVWNFTVSDSFRFKKISTLPHKRSPLFPFLRNNNSSTIAPRQQQHKDSVSCMAYYHTEGLLYTGSHDRTVKVWRVHNDNYKKPCVDSFHAHDEPITSIIINQNDGCVFTASFDASIKIWRRVYRENTHTLTMTLTFQRSPVNALALTASSGCFLYSGSSDGTINFWEKEKFSGRFNHGGFLQGHRFAVLCLAAVEEAKLVFSGSEDTSIRVWRRGPGVSHDCLAVLDGHRGPVRCLAVCLEMEKVVNAFLVYSAGLDQSFKVWRVKVLMEEEEVDCKEDLTTLSTTTMRMRRSISGKVVDRVVGESGLKNSSNVDKVSSKVLEYEISPVLSPSWVEKKLKTDNFL
ncbi:Protein JINGUBANG [Linum perenne]